MARLACLSGALKFWFEHVGLVGFAFPFLVRLHPCPMRLPFHLLLWTPFGVLVVPSYQRWLYPWTLIVSTFHLYQFPFTPRVVFSEASIANGSMRRELFFNCLLACIKRHRFRHQRCCFLKSLACQNLHLWGCKGMKGAAVVLLTSACAASAFA